MSGPLVTGTAPGSPPGHAPAVPPTSSATRHSRELFWTTLGRLVVLYFLPLLLLAAFFHVQYRYLVRDSLRAHLKVVAEHQATTFDLFLRERLVNLDNVVDDPRFPAGPVDGASLRPFLDGLQHASDAFVDLGLVNAAGELTAYAGPVRFPSPVNYRREPWFQALVAGTGGRPWVITEIYLGFRGSPHFTIAVRRQDGPAVRILRSTLSPERLGAYLNGLEGANEVHAAILTGAGAVQIATARAAPAFAGARLTPPAQPGRGFVAGAGPSGRIDYAYAWLKETPWALVVTSAAPVPAGWRAGLPTAPSAAALAILAIAGVLILVRARQVSGRQLAVEQTQAELSGQLVHAEKLASVGELAAGIAHEINNPLAIIAEEVGQLKDSLDPALVRAGDPPIELAPHLDIIHDAVFRCRDITRKLLTFVRKSEVRLEPHDVHAILDDVLEMMLGNELAISNVAVVREYDPAIPPILTDRNQLVQVFVNLVKNAMDAMPGGGTLTVGSRRVQGRARFSVRDTGCGMTREQLQKVFMPFYTTKEPGKGTGLGLSVSYMIIRNYGGNLYVESAPGRGSLFVVELPCPSAGAA